MSNVNGEENQSIIQQWPENEKISKKMIFSINGSAEKLMKKNYIFKKCESSQ